MRLLPEEVYHHYQEEEEVGGSSVRVVNPMVGQMGKRESVCVLCFQMYVIFTEELMVLVVPGHLETPTGGFLHLAQPLLALGDKGKEKVGVGGANTGTHQRPAPVCVTMHTP